MKRGALLATSCSSSDGPARRPSAQAQVTTLRFLWFTDGPDKPAIEALVKRFNDTNPDIKIEFTIVPFAELNQLLVTQASAAGAGSRAVTEPTALPAHAGSAAASQKCKLREGVPGRAGEVGDRRASEFYGIPHDLSMNGPW